LSLSNDIKWGEKKGQDGVNSINSVSQSFADSKALWSLPDISKSLPKDTCKLRNSLEILGLKSIDCPQ
jgi:hypothetical protein